MKWIKRKSLDNPELVLVVKGSLTMRNADVAISIQYTIPKIMNAGFSDLFKSVAITSDMGFLAEL